jgi:hypothetical protein
MKGDICMLEFCTIKKERIMAYKCGSREQITYFPRALMNILGEIIQSEHMTHS